eukprot:g1157.t1
MRAEGVARGLWAWLLACALCVAPLHGHSNAALSTSFHRADTADCTVAGRLGAGAGAVLQAQFSCDPEPGGGGCFAKSGGAENGKTCRGYGWDRAGCLSQADICDLPASRPAPPYAGAAASPCRGPSGGASATTYPDNGVYANTGGNLTITVLEARNLPNKDAAWGALAGGTDAYAVVNVSGTVRRTPTVADSSAPAWSPAAGGALAFGARRSGTPVSIAIVDADAGWELGDDAVGTVDTAVIFCSRFTAQQPVVQDCAPLDEVECIGPALGGNCVWDAATARCGAAEPLGAVNSMQSALPMKGAWRMPRMRACSEEAWLPLRPPVGSRAGFRLPASCDEPGAACVRVRQTVVPFDVDIAAAHAAAWRTSAEATLGVGVAITGGFASTMGNAGGTAYSAAARSVGCNYTDASLFLDTRLGRPHHDNAGQVLRDDGGSFAAAGLYGGLLLQTHSALRDEWGCRIAVGTCQAYCTALAACTSEANCAQTARRAECEQHEYASVSLNMPATLTAFFRVQDVFEADGTTRSPRSRLPWLEGWELAPGRVSLDPNTGTTFVGFSRKFGATQRNENGRVLGGTGVALGFARQRPPAGIQPPGMMYFVVATMDESSETAVIGCSLGTDLASLWPTFAQFGLPLAAFLVLWWRFLQRVDFRLDRAASHLLQHSFALPPTDAKRNVVGAAFAMYNDCPQNRDFRRNLYFASKLVHVLATTPFWIVWAWGLSAMQTAQPRTVGWAIMTLGTALLCGAFGVERWRHNGWRMTRDTQRALGVAFMLGYVFMLGHIFLQPCPVELFDLTAVFLALNALPMVCIAFASDAKLAGAFHGFVAVVSPDSDLATAPVAQVGAAAKPGGGGSRVRDTPESPLEAVTGGCFTIVNSMPTFDQAKVMTSVFGRISSGWSYFFALTSLVAYAVLCATELPGDDLQRAFANIVGILLTDAAYYLLRRGELAWSPTFVAALFVAARALLVAFSSGRFWLLGMGFVLALFGVFVAFEVVRKRLPRFGEHDAGQVTFWGRTRSMGKHVDDMTATPEFVFGYLSLVFVSLIIAAILLESDAMPMPTVHVADQEWPAWVLATIALFVMLVAGLAHATTRSFWLYEKQLLSPASARSFLFMRPVRLPFALALGAELLVVCCGLFLFGATGSSFMLTTSVFLPIIAALVMMCYIRWRKNDFALVVWPPAQELVESDDEDGEGGLLDAAQADLFSLPPLSRDDGTTGDATVITMPSLPLKSAMRENEHQVGRSEDSAKAAEAGRGTKMQDDWRTARPAWRRVWWRLDFCLRFAGSLVPSRAAAAASWLQERTCRRCNRRSRKGAKVTPGRVGAGGSAPAPIVDLQTMSVTRAFCEGYLLGEDYAVVGAFASLLVTIAVYGVVVFLAEEPSWLGIAIGVGLYVLLFTIAPFVKYFNSYRITADMRWSWAFGFALLVVAAAFMFNYEMKATAHDPRAFQVLTLVVLYPTLLLFGACWYTWYDDGWELTSGVRRGFAVSFVLLAFWVSQLFVWEGLYVGIPFAVAYVVFLAVSYFIFVYVDHESYLPPWYQRLGHSLLVFGVVAALVVGFILGAELLFTLSLAFFFVTAKLVLQVVARRMTRASGSILYVSPYVFPVFSFEPHKDRLVDESQQFCDLYAAMLVALLWAATCAVFVAPSHVGIAAFAAAVLLLLTVTFHFMSLTAFDVRRASACISKGLMQDAGRQVRGCFSARRLELDIRCQEWVDKERQEAQYEAELERLTHGMGDGSSGDQRVGEVKPPQGDDGDFLKQVDSMFGGGGGGGVGARGASALDDEEMSEAMRQRRSAASLAKVIEELEWLIVYEEDTEGREVRRFDGLMSWADALVDAMRGGHGPIGFLRVLLFPYAAYKAVQRRCCKRAVQRSKWDEDGARRVLDMRPLADTKKQLRELLEADMELAYEFAEEFRCMAHLQMLAVVCAQAQLDRERTLFQRFLRENRFKLMSNGINPPKDVFRTQSYASIDIAHVAVWLLGLSGEERERFHELKAHFTEEVAVRDLLVDEEDAQNRVAAEATRAKQRRREAIMCRQRYSDFQARRERRKEEGTEPKGMYDESLVNAQEQMVEIDSGWSCSAGKAGSGRELQFNDAEFVADAESVGNASCARDIVGWRAAPEVCKEAALYVDGTDPDDIYQGRFQDGWLLSALSIVAASGGVDDGGVDKLVDHLFITKAGDSSTGAYQLRLWLNGQWETVLVDDKFPVMDSRHDDSPSAGSATAHTTGFRGLWVPLIEKAVAKYYGSYSWIEDGQVTHALNMLTGSEAREVFLANESRGPRKAMLWDNLLRWRRNRFLLGAGTITADSADHEIQDSGIVFGAVYVVYDVRDVDGRKLLRLRNPPGEHAEWVGDWGDRSPLWTRRLKAKCGWTDEADNTFWISFDDFCHAFRSLYVCQHFHPQHWPAKDFYGEWTEDFAAGVPTKYNPECSPECSPQYSLVVRRPTELCLTLSQVDSEGLAAPEVHPIVVYVVQHAAKDRAMRVYALNTQNVVASSGDVVRERTVKCYCRLAPRAYTIMCGTFLKGMEGPFKLSVQSNFPVGVRPLWPAPWKDGDEPEVSRTRAHARASGVGDGGGGGGGGGVCAVADEMAAHAKLKAEEKAARSKKKGKKGKKDKKGKKGKKDKKDGAEKKDGGDAKNGDAGDAAAAVAAGEREEAQRQRRKAIEECPWVKQWDANSRKHYYYNVRTNITVWEQPADYIEGKQDDRLDAATAIQSRFRGNKARSDGPAAKVRAHSE